MEKILTISVAAYNVEKYLDKLCNTIIASGCIKDLEVLIVDDGSSDNTVQIAKKYEQIYPNDIKYVKKKNGGHGSTINKGIELAHGKYFKVLDGDDWVDSKGLEKLITILKSEDVDLFVTNRKRVFENIGKEIIDKPRGIQENKILYIEDICNNMDRLLFHSVFVRTRILKTNNIYIDENCFYVDNEILWYPFPYIDTIYYLNETVYCYRLGLADQSVNANVIAKRIDQHEFVNKQIVKFYIDKRNELSTNKGKYFDRVIADNISWHIETLLLLKFSRKNWKRIVEYVSYIKERIPNIEIYVTAKAVKKILENPYVFYPVAWAKKGKIRRNK